MSARKVFLQQFSHFTKSLKLRKLSNMPIKKEHLVTGDPLPPFKENLLRIYSMKFCPYAQRSRIVLKAKNIEHEIVNVSLAEKPDWFLERNPLGLVPVTELNGKIVYESLIVSDYLDEAYPGNNPLYPNDPYLKARHKMIIDHFNNKVIPPHFKYLHSKFSDQKLLNSMYEGFDKLQEFLKSDGGDYFGGDKIQMVDYVMWPFFERMLMWDLFDQGLPRDRYPALFGWIERAKQDPAIKSTLTSPELLKKFLLGYREGKPQFDFEEE